MVKLELNNKANGRVIPMLILFGLLFLRFPLLIARQYNIISNPNIFSIYSQSTYLLTALLIVIERNRLSDFNIGLSSILLFILIPIMRPVIYIALSNKINWQHENSVWLQISWAQVIIGIFLAIILIYYRTSLARRKIKIMILWLVISVMIGLLFALIEGYIYRPFEQINNTQVTLNLFFYLFITQLSNAAIMEEPLFRGFIWGYLRKRKWKPFWILLFQALLFNLAHIYYLPSSPSFYTLTFFAGIILGIVVWKSKNISTSIIVHGLINSVGDLAMHFTW